MRGPDDGAEIVRVLDAVEDDEKLRPGHHIIQIGEDLLAAPYAITP